MNRDRGKWVGPLKGVHVTMYTAWHARAVLLRMAAIKTTCQFHSFVDGHLGYSHVLGWEERKSSRLMARGEIFIQGKSEGNFIIKCKALATCSHRLEPQFKWTYSKHKGLFKKWLWPKQVNQLINFFEMSLLEKLESLKCWHIIITVSIIIFHFSFILTSVSRAQVVC